MEGNLQLKQNDTAVPWECAGASVPTAVGLDPCLLVDIHRHGRSTIVAQKNKVRARLRASVFLVAPAFCIE